MSFLVFGMARSSPLSFASDSVNLGPSPSSHSFARLESAVLALDLVYVGLFSIFRSFAYLGMASFALDYAHASVLLPLKLLS